MGELQSHAVHGATDEYLRRGMYAATHHVYAGLVVIAVIAFGILLRTPRRFPVADHAVERPATGEAGTNGKLE